jgi:hypothetical protein
MKLCFILPGTKFSSYFLMVWTDLVLKCAQKGHEVMVSQRKTRPECFDGCKDNTYDAYLCIDPEAVFKTEDVFTLFESPHDVTGVMMMSPDLMTLTCGKLMESLIHEKEYVSADRIDPSFVLLRTIPEGWNFTDPIAGFIDVRIRVGNEVTIVV